MQNIKLIDISVQQYHCRFVIGFESSKVHANIEINMKLEKVYVKHYALNHMPDTKREWLVLTYTDVTKTVSIGSFMDQTHANIEINMKLEKVFVKHYVPNHMLDPKREWLVLTYIDFTETVSMGSFMDQTQPKEGIYFILRHL